MPVNFSRVAKSVNFVMRSEGFSMPLILRLVREGRASAAPKMAMNAGEAEEVSAIDEQEGDCSAGEAGAAMEIEPPSHSPAGSLPPADVAAVGMH